MLSKSDSQKVLSLCEKLSISLSLTLGILSLLISLSDLIRGVTMSIFGGIPLTILGLLYLVSAFMLVRRYYISNITGICVSILFIILTLFSHQPIEVVLLFSSAASLIAILLIITLLKTK